MVNKLYGHTMGNERKEVLKSCSFSWYQPSCGLNGAGSCRGVGLQKHRKAASKCACRQGWVRSTRGKVQELNFVSLCTLLESITER